MKYDPAPRVIALILICAGMAFQMKSFDATSLAKMDSMTPADYMQHERTLHMHSGLHWFFLLLIIGGFFAGALDFIAYLVGRFLRRGQG